jgi:uncharacterized membrane protein
LNYGAFKFLHILGVILLIGNVSVTSIWKVFADRTANASVVSFAQRLVTHTDWTLTGGGIFLTVLGGYGMVWQFHMPLFQFPWLLWSQVLFAFSGGIWLFMLIPIQIAQARLARQFSSSDSIGDAYLRYSRLWLRWGIGATVPLIAALYLMVVKVY